MTLRDRIDAIKKYFQPDGGVFIPPDIGFDHTKWSKSMLEQMAANISMADMLDTKPETVDVMTKALIVQHLGDISARHPGVSIRRIISDVFANGVKDDYDLLDKLIAADKAGFKDEKSGTEIMIRTKRAEGRVNHLQDAMSYMQRGMLDNLRNANNPPMRVRSVDCSDPADKSGSSSAK